jgi:HSP20 family molecular chaperone IbpA
MKTKLLVFSIIILIVIVIYQSYKIYNLTDIKNPKVTINIQQNTQDDLHDNNISILKNSIQESFTKLFHDLFKDQAIQDEFNKSIDHMQREFKKLSDSSLFFRDILKEFNIKKYKTFQDMGSRYELKLQVPSQKNANIQIDIKKGFVYIDINTTIKSNNIYQSSTKQHIVQLPTDSLIKAIKSDYKDDILTITIPKVKSTQSI